MSTPRFFPRLLAGLTLLLALAASPAALADTVPVPASLTAALGDWLSVPLSQANASLCAPGNAQPPVSLRLDGFDTGLVPIACDSTLPAPTLYFRLSPRFAKNGGDDKALGPWAGILAHPWRYPNYTRNLELKLIGAQGELLQAPQRLQLTLVSRPLLWLGLALIAVAWAIIAVAGRRSSLLRDSNSTASALQRPYSLARVQMTWWFALTFAAYVLLWVITGEWVEIPPTILALIGISGVTGLTATGIDTSNPDDRQVGASQGFFRDILTDVNGITLARLQFFLWNLAFGLFFLVRVFTDLQFPLLDPTILALLGLSAGTYVGFKVPEKQQADDSTTSETDPKTAYSPQ